ncbi:hypothetical protein [Acinetobacter pittii]|uniref:hypothetical protein n=1 Tax=Acinetobacter pittii TaxID=48296 RepID=UPI00355BF3F9
MPSVFNADIRQDLRLMTEFALRMNVTEKELYERIKDGRIKPPNKDGRKNFWLNSYVLSCIREGADDSEIQELRA